MAVILIIGTLSVSQVISTRQSVIDKAQFPNRFLEDTNDHPKPFTWTADPERIISAVKRVPQALDSIHLGGQRHSAVNDGCLG